MSIDTVFDELRKTVEPGVTDPSDSPYLPPIVIVKKKNGSNRFCIDFRTMNKNIVFVSENIPNADDIFVKHAQFHLS